MRFAVMVRDAVRAIGRPSGMKAMATETQSTIKVGILIHPGCSFLRYVALKMSENPSIGSNTAYQTIMTIMIMATIIEHITITKLRISFSKGVMPVFGSFVIWAILPKTVVSPVETTIPIPLPDTQCVP
jgi:hypothetical protein